MAVPNGRSIIGVVNKLLDLPFRLRIATQDWHPVNHVSFASNHSGLRSQPFEDIALQNPLNESETQSITLWPDHCVENTFGAALVSELNSDKIDHIVKKGQDHRVEMWSAFKDVFANPVVYCSELTQILEKASISCVYVVGLAADFCVKHTALHAAQEGLKTIVLCDATKAIDATEGGLKKLMATFQESKIQYVGTEDAHLL